MAKRKAGQSGVAETPAGQFKRKLLARLWVRFHMSLILMTCGLTAMLASWTLLHLGMGSMLVRYPIVVAIAYGMFLACIALWLKYVASTLEEEPEPEPADAPPATRAAARRRSKDGLDLDLPSGGGGGGSSSGGGSVFSGKGGGFDGGGASASWAESGPRVPVPNNAFAGQSLASPAGDSPLADAAASGGGGSKGGFDFDLGGGDGDGFLIVLALAVVVAVLAASGYLVFAAPEILSEAAFGALLAGGLARRARTEDNLGWVTGVVKRTWWPFAAVLAIAVVFAAYAHNNYPQAKTFREALAQAATAGSP